MMYAFAVTIYARPDVAAPGTEVTLRGQTLPTISVPAAVLVGGFPRSFEEVGDALNSLERLYFEPDGSFVWVSSAGEPKWQLDGLLADLDGRVTSLELKGICPPAAFERALAVLGAPPAIPLFMLTHEAVALDEAAFRNYAQSGEASTLERTG